MTTTTKRTGIWASVVLIVLGAIGGALVLGQGIANGVVTAFAGGSTSGSLDLTADVSDATGVAIDSAGGSVDVTYADVEEAELSVESDGGSTGDWAFAVDDEGTLVVSETGTWGWSGWDWWGDEGNRDVTVTLPASLEGDDFDLDVDLAAGDATIDGDFGDVELDMSAGQTTFTGSAANLATDIAAGTVHLDAEVPGEVELQLSAGGIDGALTGQQPTSISVDASAGEVRLDVPAGEYSVEEDVSAGSSTVDVDERDGARSTIVVDVSAGQVVLTATGR